MTRIVMWRRLIFPGPSNDRFAPKLGHTRMDTPPGLKYEKYK